MYAAFSSQSCPVYMIEHAVNRYTPLLPPNISLSEEGGEKKGTYLKV